MSLQWLSFIMFRLFIIVEMNHRMLINSKQTILMTAKKGPAAAVSSGTAIHSRMSAYHSPITMFSRVLNLPGYNFGSSNGSVLSGKRSSERRAKRASGPGAAGMQISPDLTLKVTDVFNRPLMGSQGPTELRVGDSVRFIITLTRDGTYNSLEVMSCTMSTSVTMPDPKAETRVLMVKGCPIQDEATADSWYWTSELSTNATFITNTQAVPVFRLSSSDYIYLHCAMKMCFVGYAPCQQPTRQDCIATGFKRKKREVLLSMRRRRSEPTDGVTDVNQTLALRVIDPVIPTSNNPFEVGTSAFVALIVLISLIGCVVIILIIILLVILVDRKPKRRRVSQPQEFAQQRVTPTNRRCPTCC